MLSAASGERKYLPHHFERQQNVVAGQFEMIVDVGASQAGESVVEYLRARAKSLILAAQKQPVFHGGKVLRICRLRALLEKLSRIPGSDDSVKQFSSVAIKGNTAHYS